MADPDVALPGSPLGVHRQSQERIQSSPVMQTAQQHSLKERQRGGGIKNIFIFILYELGILGL